MAKARFQGVYDRSPIWAQNAAVSIKGWQLRLGRSHDRLIRENLNFLATTEFWSEAQFREYQTAELRKLLDTAFRHVPYYRELSQRLGCKAEDFRSPEDLRQLPVTDKYQVRGNEEQFLNETIPRRELKSLFTSGTTGMPMHVYETVTSWSKRWSYVARLRSWIGVSNPLHPRRIQITGKDIVPARQRKDVFWRYNHADNSLLFSSVHISPRTAPLYAQAMRDFQPELMDGFPSCMLTIARCAPPELTRIPSLKAIITTSETVSAADRALLTSAFGAPVWDQYAATEPAAFWSNCQHGVMHMHPEYGISEILDESGNDVEPGHEGRIISTSFQNHAMILLRYQIGDKGVRGPRELCACGRNMPRVGEITGRTEDYLYIPERGFVMRLDSILKGLGNVIETQIVQENLDHLRILLIPADGYDPTTEHKMLENLRIRIGDAVRVTVEHVDQIPRGPNGKFKALVTKVRDQYPVRL